MGTSVDDDAVAIFRFASGLHAVIGTRLTFHAGVTTTEISVGRDGGVQFHSDGAPAESFRVAVLRGEAERPAMGIDGAEPLRMILAAYRASEEGRTIALEDVGS